ncbi:MAG: YARHG domain-containing protein [Ruminococcus sp.]|nr:YARHG domain-containing protein [Ruminococcus sp.]
MRCPYCGSDNKQNMKFCGKCGANLNHQNISNPRNNDKNNYNDNYQKERKQTEFYEDIVTKKQLKKAQNATRTKIILITVFSIIILGLLGVIAYLVFGSGMGFSFSGETKVETTVAEETTEAATEKTVTVPAVAGYDYNLALQRLSNVNLKVTYTSEYSDNVYENCVISQTPDPGTEVKEGTEVQLVVSKGRENKQSSLLSTNPSDNTDPSSGDGTVNSSDYIIPESSSRYLTYDDIKNLDEDQLELARNEIFARHGRKFNSDKLQRYFYSKPWYRGTIEPEEFDEGLLNEYEIANITYIYEQEQYVDDYGHANPNL